MKPRLLFIVLLSIYALGRNLVPDKYNPQFEVGFIIIAWFLFNRNYKHFEQDDEPKKGLCNNDKSQDKNKEIKT
jgi:hypothetical protein